MSQTFQNLSLISNVAEVFESVMILPFVRRILGFFLKRKEKKTILTKEKEKNLLHFPVRLSIVESDAVEWVAARWLPTSYPRALGPAGEDRLTHLSALPNTKTLYISVGSQETLTRGEITYAYSRPIPAPPTPIRGCHLAAHWLRRTRKRSDISDIRT